MKRLLTLLILLVICLVPAMSYALPIQFGGESPFAEDTPLMEIIFLDVYAAGDAFLLRCGGESMLIDSGHDPYWKHLVQHMRDRNITHINYFLSTHVHADHLSGFRYLIIRDFGPDLMYLATALVPGNDLQALLIDKIEKYKIPTQRIYDGDNLSVGDANVLVMRAQGDWGTNGKSVCNMITFGDARVLLMADATGQAQDELMLKYGDTMKADIVKMAHHGLNPSVKGFYDLVKPNLAILTNVYKDAAVTALNQIEDFEIPLMWTTKGNIIAQTDGKQWYVYQEPKIQPSF